MGKNEDLIVLIKPPKPKGLSPKKIVKLLIPKCSASGTKFFLRNICKITKNKYGIMFKKHFKKFFKFILFLKKKY